MFVNEIKLTKHWFTALITLYVLIILKTTYSINFGYFDYLFLPIAGIATLYFQYGKMGVKKLLKLPKANMLLWTPLIALSCILIGASTVLIGKLLGIANLSANQGIEQISNSNDLFSKGMFYALGWIHLLGEELITAAVCLPILILLLKYTSKKIAIFTSVLVSSLVFGAIHLPTYDWNVYQSLIVISAIRVPFTFMWFKSKSLLGGAIPHIALDYILISTTLFL
ncbi:MULTISPECIES: CPBP family glutamic-type intramembrane protease [Staphylococcus]|uniref:CPBP family glutamic-type intramembrane protease n=1 Tax=Staphylococcus TaxID=1279 RepID=UPI0004E3F108|nr:MULTISPECIES: CPBP family glutamic-type intramembrane protease [Staphylococcus]KFE42959.1 hypothetical protein SAGN_01560 [Staphylococcus agnetis]MCO4327027.1 CPBP family glutamic-type intramembrane protease [Staphylococcus agnetis]MCO4330858.1 CPBP family glutamic-type intramembrane protease [Staphylococcus hyicus]MCO4334362.1 CPBP family glutamic-type intramembrane protease [Staphylococcus hyicus]MCO4369689.1 CPBP family glutamic-type intramembrane protease [Staphylococcus agnetis]